MTAEPTAFSLANAHARILLVDDEERMLESLKALLAPYSLNIDTALGGKEACAKLLRQQYDLVLLDLRMQDIDGHKVMDFMADKGIQSATIVVSGESTFSAASKALRRGAYDYIKKPYAAEELIATVSSALKKQSLEKSHSAMQVRLQKSEELHRYIVNSSPDIVFMLDMEGRFTFLNSKIETLLGYRKNELIGKNYVQLIDDKDKSKARYFIKEKMQVENSGVNMEVRLRCRDDQRLPRYFEITFFPIQSSSLTLKKLGPTPNKSKFIGIYGTARDITERKEAEEFINFQAYHDLLTRLPNRALFKDRLSLAITQAKRNEQQLAVMFLDLDRFKIVNDTLGHAMGDRLLQSVAMRLESVLRAGDTLSRFGGDEFTLLLPAITTKEDARKIARKVINVLKEPFMLGDNEVFVGVSIGISVFPEAGNSMEQLVQNADVAMYHVKGRGKDGYQFFTEAMNIDCSNRLKLERDLRKALENEEFRVYYQPQVDTQTGHVVGVEALIRWHHPERGIIYPSEFISLAEETKLIADIGDWVLRTACNEVRQWIASGLSNIRLSVNFSPLQVEHPRFVENLFKQLQQADFPASNFEVELTENLIMRDLENMTHKLSQLASQGMSIAIDDFGTGYSSLHYLNKLPIHTLKVDRSFIKDIQDSASESCIVNAIVAMAHGLKLNIIAEGVETVHQLDYLKKLKCQEVQGFYFGKAMPGKELFHSISTNFHHMAV
ncbi:MAG: EAL domain-containing protein [Hahellaceae bacterium]|nr:EAL domain-containing protein [Hahellaceae bacterium]